MYYQEKCVTFCCSAGRKPKRQEPEQRTVDSGGRKKQGIQGLLIPESPVFMPGNRVSLLIFLIRICIKYGKSSPYMSVRRTIWGGRRFRGDAFWMYGQESGACGM